MKVGRGIGSTPEVVGSAAPADPPATQRDGEAAEAPAEARLFPPPAGPARATPPAVGRYPQKVDKPKSFPKSRSERPDIYPARFAVPDDKVAFSVPFPSYAPPEFTAPVVLAQAKPGGWADPPDPKARKAPIVSYTGPLHFDAAGRPENPTGRTGIAGRGLLGRWGPNFAADPIVTRKSPETGALEMLAIRRKDSGEWAIPGGMVDEGETLSATLAREFREETGVELDMADAVELYRGYADDRRNTDHAWMETTVSHKHLPAALAAKMEPVAGDDAADVRWMPLTPANVAKLYGDHRRFVELAIARLNAPSK